MISKRWMCAILGLVLLMCLCAGAMGESGEAVPARKVYTAGESVVLEGRIAWYKSKPGFAILKLFKPIEIRGVPGAEGTKDIEACTEIQLEGKKLSRYNKQNVRVQGILDGKRSATEYRDVVLRQTKIAKKMAQVKSVAITDKPKVLMEGDTWKLGSRVRPTNAPAELEWVSINPRVATVTQDGLVTAMEPGETEIMLYGANNKQAGYLLTVSVPATRMRIGFVRTMLVEGETFKIHCAFDPLYAAEEALTYTSSRPSVASVSKTGLVTAKSVGFTMITVRTSSGFVCRYVHNVLKNKAQKQIRQLSEGKFSTKDLDIALDGHAFSLRELTQEQVMKWFPGGKTSVFEPQYDSQTRTWIMPSAYAYHNTDFYFYNGQCGSISINTSWGTTTGWKPLSIETSRGLKSGDSLEAAIQMYGLPVSMRDDLYGGICAEYDFLPTDDPTILGSISLCFDDDGRGQTSLSRALLSFGDSANAFVPDDGG